MPVIFYLAENEDAPKLTNLPFDQEDSWWGGVWQCAASIGLGAVLAITASSTQLAQTATTGHQDDPAGRLLDFTVDEVYWQNPVAPVPATQYVGLPLTDPELIPAGTLTIGPLQEDFSAPPLPWEGTWTLLFFLDDGTSMPGFSPEEDLWQQTSLVPPVPATMFIALPISGEYDAVPFVAVNPEEEFWQNPVAPIPLTFGSLYLPDPEEISAATLQVNLDEDLWQNPTAPVVDSLVWPQQFAFDNPDVVRAFIADDTATWLTLFPAPTPATLFQVLPLPLGGQFEIEGDSATSPIIVVSGFGDIEAQLNKLETPLRSLNQL